MTSFHLLDGDTHFIGVAWNQTCNISEVRLCYLTLLGTYCMLDAVLSTPYASLNPPNTSLMQFLLLLLFKCE